LGTTFGRGGATTFQQDLQNADCIIIEGSNMAECHPVGFQWVMEAKARGATIIHVDPRFTRTSAVADLHVPIRAGSDIAFLGGLVNYILSGGHEFHDYLVAYTNAPVILREDFQDTEDLDGLFSGFDPEHRQYDGTTWQYEGTEVAAAAGQRDTRYAQRTSARGEAHGSGGAPISGEPERDESLQHPRCVYNVLKRHFARYTPEMVERICGIPLELFYRVAAALVANSGRDRTTAFAYAVGWTQHTVGVQYIRTAAILQTLLGNIGRPGGGILALRGHASIQGSTDIPTLFNLLPGYIPMPYAHEHESLADFITADAGVRGFWGNMKSYTVSLLKAWWGDAATADNDYCFDYLPRLTGNHSTYHTGDGTSRPRWWRVLPGRREPGRRFGQRQAAAAGPVQHRLARSARLLPDRECHVVAERPRDRDRRDAHRGHRHRGFLPAGRRAHREGRQFHQHATVAAMASQGSRARR
jgi:formate dehydrogenase major subunit